MERILGVNLSGWFIPEPWVTPSLYAATGASNAAELQEAMGTAAYNERMRRHYETFVSEDDFRRMAQIGLNAVRLPVPWYAFGSQESDASYISVVVLVGRDALLSKRLLRGRGRLNAQGGRVKGIGGNA